jgi:quercetin dioxygenase-like cupin family protein
MKGSGAGVGVQRASLGAYTVGGKRVERLEMHRLTLPPGGRTGRHTHPGPVASYVVEGRIVVQIEGEPPKTFAPGETIFEPAGTKVLQFDNESATEPAVFIATYLLGAEDRTLIDMID